MHATHNLHAISLAQMLRELLRKINGSMLTAGATEGNHQNLENPRLILATLASTSDIALARN